MSETGRFTEDILTAAKQKAQNIIAEAETQAQQALDEAKTQISREVDDVLNSARTEAEAVKRRRMSEARHRTKLQEQEERSKILSEVLEATKKRTVELTRDEAKYTPYLVSYIESSIRDLGSESVLIHLNATDLKRIDKVKVEREIAGDLQRPVKVEFSKDPIEAIGGAVLSSLDGRTRIINTLDERFEALEPKLLIEAGKILFSE